MFSTRSQVHCMIESSVVLIDSTKNFTNLFSIGFNNPSLCMYVFCCDFEYDVVCNLLHFNYLLDIYKLFITIR